MSLNRDKGVSVLNAKPARGIVEFKVSLRMKPPNLMRDFSNLIVDFVAIVSIWVSSHIHAVEKVPFFQRGGIG